MNCGNTKWPQTRPTKGISQAKKEESFKLNSSHKVKWCVAVAAERERPQARRRPASLRQVPGGAGWSGQVADGHGGDGGQPEASLRRLQGCQGTASRTEGNVTHRNLNF